MKTVFLLLISMISFAAYSQSDNPQYDKALAESLGGDDYGMKMYVFAILKTGTNTTETKTVSDSLFRGHMANMTKLADAGKLTVAGPFAKNDKQYRGLFILNVKTLEEAKALIATDPAINAKLLDAELFRWYGSAALPVYLQSHEKIEKKKM